MSEDKTTGKKKARSSYEQIVREWWRDLNGMGEARPADAAGRAQLRRAHDLIDVFSCPAFHGLLRRLKITSNYQREALAVTAGVLAHVKEDTPKIKFGMSLGKPPNKGGTSPMAEIRFRRLLQARDPEEMMNQLRRAVRLLRGSADVQELALLIRYWSKRDRQLQLATDYYAHAPARS